LAQIGADARKYGETRGKYAQFDTKFRALPHEVAATLQIMVPFAGWRVVFATSCRRVP
jgi:hypothetical protein